MDWVRLFCCTATVCCLLAFAANSASITCKHDEFLSEATNSTNSTCCPKCRAGHRVKEACGEFTGTTCVSCTAGSTYLDKLNGEKDCKNCTTCNGEGLIVVKSCTTTSNTVCGCGNGYHCVDTNGTMSCSQCAKNTECKLGQRVVSPATSHNDTVCANCSDGTYSPSVTSRECLNHTNCTAVGSRLVLNGTSYADAVCSSTPWTMSLSEDLGAIIVTVFIILLVLLFIFWFTRWLWRQSTQPGEEVELSGCRESTGSADMSSCENSEAETQV